MTLSLQVVGRQPEMEAIRQALDACANSPQTVLIEGEAGIGKTTIWLQAVAEARTRGCPCSAAAASSPSSASPSRASAICGSPRGVGRAPSW